MGRDGYQSADVIIAKLPDESVERPIDEDHPLFLQMNTQPHGLGQQTTLTSVAVPSRSKDPW